MGTTTIDIHDDLAGNPDSGTPKHNPNINEADVFEAVVDRLPDAPAITFDETTYTFREFDNLCNQLANVFQDRGIKPGDRVMLLARNVPEHLASILALMKIRAAAINTNFMYNSAEITYLAENAEACGVVVEEEFSEKLASVIGANHKLRWVLVIGDPHPTLIAVANDAGVELVRAGEVIPVASPSRVQVARSGDDEWILYTGGTTGDPKGVLWRAADYYYACLSGGNAYGPPRHSPQEVAENATSGLQLIICAPLMHGAGMFSILTFLNSGGHVVLQRSFKAENVVRVAAERKVTGIVIVGDAMGVPLADAIESCGTELDLSSLLVVGSGGGIWSQTNQERIKSLLPNVMLRDSVGASESGNDGEMSFDDAGRLRLDPARGIVLVDELLNPLPVGSNEIGYIARTGHLPKEYLGDPDKTAATFVTIDGVRASLLGDMGHYGDDGKIVFLGRGSGVINSGGEKIFAEEVESALKRHPAVYDALVVGAPDERYGQSVAAVVSLRSDQPEPSEAELREHTAGLLARYKAPRQIRVVDWVRRTPAGKADYRWAKAQFGA